MPRMPVFLSIFLWTDTLMPRSETSSALIIKWKKDAEAYGSLVTDESHRSCSRALKLSKSRSCPQKTCAIGSCVSAGFIVNQIEGGPFLTHIPHINDRIFIRDSSVPMTFARMVVKSRRSAFIVGFENGLRACSSVA